MEWETTESYFFFLLTFLEKEFSLWGIIYSQIEAFMSAVVYFWLNEFKLLYLRASAFVLGWNLKLSDEMRFVTFIKRLP